MHAERTDDWRPYAALQIALLMDAFKVLGRAPLIVQRPTARYKRLRFNDGQAFLLAVRWLLATRDDHPFDYRTICQAFGLDMRRGPRVVKRIVAHRLRLATAIRKDPEEQARIVWRATDGKYWGPRIKPTWMKELTAKGK